MRGHVCVLIGLLVSAAYPTQAGQDQPEPRPFQTEVNYVRVDLYPTVNDKPLVGLLPSEVEVLEDGVPQKIDRFEHVSIGGVRPQATRPDPSSVSDMRRAAQDPRARVFVLFLDPRHVDLQGSMQVRRPLIDALNSLVGGDDLIAVMTPEMSARNLTFTRRTASIEQMLTPHWGQESWPGTKDVVEARYEACYGPPIIDGEKIAQEMIARRREMLVLNAVDGLVEFLRGLREERKAVITISDGWRLYGPDRNLEKPLLVPGRPGEAPGNVNVPVPTPGRDPRTGRPTVKDPSDSFTISNDGVGTIDRASCEVDRTALAQMSNEQRFVGLMQAANRSNVSFYPVGPGGLSKYVPDSARRRSLEMMADITDGHATLQPFNIETNIRRIVEDLSSYYLLGYYSNAKPDGRYHRISVRIKRPGVLVRARAGYLAASAAEAASRVSSAKPSPDVAEAQLVAGALNPLAALGRERPVRVQAAVAWTPARRAIVRAVAEVPRGTARSGDDWSKGGQIDVTLRNGSGVAVATERIALEPGMFTAEWAFTPAEPLEPGSYDLQVRAKGVGVLSPAADAIQLTVHAAPLGGGVLFLRRGPTTGNREVLTADARFRRAERLILESPASIGGDVSARLLDRTGNPMNVPVTAGHREGADGARWHRVEIALSPLAAGDYIIESTAGLERTMTGFRVVP